jgi:hypothetical protein
MKIEEVQMRFLFTILILLSMEISSQTYLNVHYVNGTSQHALLSTMTKITFNFTATQINFYLKDLGLITLNTDLIQRVTFDDTGQGGILPVELGSFSAKVNGTSVNLLWKTITELNSNAFEIQRKPVNPGKLTEWATIGSIKSAGSSSSPKNYFYEDKQLQTGKYDYRLKMIDNDGTFEYSNILEIVISVPKEFYLSQNYPNPFNPTTKIIYSLPTDGVVTLIVYDIMGKEVVTLINENKKAGCYETILDGTGLSSGVYFYKLIAGYVNLTKKMIVIK